MSNENRPCGLRPLSNPYGNVRASVYKAVTGSALYMFSPVDMNASGYVELATAGSGNFVLGSVIGMLNGKFGPISDAYPYIPANPAADEVDSDGYMNVIVADDPNQEFIVQEASTGTALTAAARFLGANLYNASSGNTRSGVSMCTMDRTSAVSAQSSQQLRLIDIWDKEDNDFGDYALWRCRIYYHRFNPPSNGSIGSTI